MKKALVTGAPGFVGSYVCRELLNNGYEVRALHRSTSNIEALKNLNVQLVTGDITDPESLINASRDCDVVFHIAAAFREAKHPDQYYFDVNAQGTRNVFEAAITNGVKKVIHCSTTGVHGHIANPPGDENSPIAPRDVYQRSKVEAEKIANEYYHSGKIKGAIIRPGMIWGPGDKRFLKLFRGIQRGNLPIIGDGTVWTHWIMVDDLARAFRLAAERDEANGEAFIIVGDRPVSMQYVYEKIAEAFGKKPSFWKIPVFPLWLTGAICELIYLPFGAEPPLFRRRVDFYTKNRSFNTQKSKRLLGFQPTRTFEDEVKLLADWYKENRWIEATA